MSRLATNTYTSNAYNGYPSNGYSSNNAYNSNGYSNDYGYGQSTSGITSKNVFSIYIYLYVVSVE